MGDLDAAGLLVPAANAGDREALNLIVTDVRRCVIRFVRARLSTYSGGAEVSEDVTQEVCLAVVDILPRYDDSTGAPFGALVYKIAANKVADAQRRYARTPFHVVEELPERADDLDQRPEAQVMFGRDVETARLLVGRLPGKWPEIVWLRAQGYTSDEVGEIVGLTGNAVRVNHHRAMKRLRKETAAA